MSKLDSLVVLEFLGLLLGKLSGDLLSIRFVLFMLVGASGLAVHLLALKGVLSASALSFDLAQTCAAFVAMTWNFFLNNVLTYRDRRLHGLAALKGLISFYAVCTSAPSPISGSRAGCMADGRTGGSQAPRAR